MIHKKKLLLILALTLAFFVVFRVEPWETCGYRCGVSFTVRRIRHTPQVVFSLHGRFIRVAYWKDMRIKDPYSAPYDWAWGFDTQPWRED